MFASNYSLLPYDLTISASFPACHCCIGQCTLVLCIFESINDPPTVLSCLSAPSTAKSLIRASPMILMGSNCGPSSAGARASAPASKRPVHETLQSAKQVNATLSATIDPATAVGVSLPTPYRKLSTTHFICPATFHRSPTKECISNCTAAHLAKKIYPCRPLRFFGEILSAL